METSDSEYFESADEDFQSDEENTETVKIENVKIEKNAIIQKIDDVAKKVEILQVLDDENMNSDDVSETQSDLDNIGQEKHENFEVANKVAKNEKIVEKVAKTEENIVEKSPEVIKDENMNKDDKNKVKGSLDNTIKEKIVEKVKETPELDVKNVNIKETTEKDNIVKKPVKEAKFGNKIGNKKKNIKPLEDIKPPNIQKAEEKPQIIEKTAKTQENENLWDDDEIDWGKEEELSKNTPNILQNPAVTSKTPPNSPKTQNQWENDDWEPLEAPPQNNPQSDSSWGSWGTWGVSSILNTATASVSTLTTHVSQGISTVLESGMGVPDPEELARQHRQDEEKIIRNFKDSRDGEGVKEEVNSPGNALGGFGLGNLVSGVSQLTKLVESTGTKVISGGLDTLETIGKKTMEVLQEGDPGLKKKRAFLKLDQNKPILSQVLREAKEKSDEENNKTYERCQVRVKTYETLFDDHQGLVHLEALEMLSKQCDIKLETLSDNLSGSELTEMQETLEQVKELCELPEEDEDDQLTLQNIKENITLAIKEINIPITYEKLDKTWEETETWLETLKLNLVDEKELHQQAIETLAQLTAISVEQFHKTAELLLVKENRSTADEADSLVQLTTSLIALIGVVAAKFSDKLNSKAPMVKNKESLNELITNVFFEASNSSSYIQDAFQLLIPVLQVGAV